MIHNDYLKNIIKALEKTLKCSSNDIESASEIVADVIENDGIIYIFGCGHSHLVGLDSFYRAGGLANVCAIRDADLMLFNGAAKSSVMEHMIGIAPEIFRRYNITKNDVLFVVSTSGKNCVPVEMADIAKSKGIKVIGIASSEYLEAKREYTNSLLKDCVDIFIDNCVPYGDACINIPNCKTKMGSISTITSTYIVQSVLMEAAAKCSEKNIDIPVYMSGNVEGGADYNRGIIDKYIHRIKHL